MPDFRVFELEERQLAQAYPLVRSATGVTSPRWQDFAHETFVAGGGVLGVETEDGCLYGLAAFRSQDTLRHGAALCVELLVAIDLASGHPVRTALCRRLDMIARDRGLCSIIVSTRPGCLTVGWSDCDLEADTVDYVRLLRGPEGGGPAARPGR
jgi:hypothetical protein